MFIMSILMHPWHEWTGSVHMVPATCASQLGEQHCLSVPVQSTFTLTSCPSSVKKIFVLCADGAQWFSFFKYTYNFVDLLFTTIKDFEGASVAETKWKDCQRAYYSVITRLSLAWRIVAHRSEEINITAPSSPAASQVQVSGERLSCEWKNRARRQESGHLDE